MVTFKYKTRACRVVAVKLLPYILKRRYKMSNNLCASPNHLKNTAAFGGKKAMKHALRRAAKRIKELQFENYQLKQTVNGGKIIDESKSY